MPCRAMAVCCALALLAACHKAPDAGAGPAHIIPKPASPAPVQDSAPGLRLPAVFRGTEHCSDCRAIDTYLELRGDHSYLLEERYLGDSGETRRLSYTMGHFSLSDGRLRLEVAAEPPRYRQVAGPASLRQLGPHAHPLRTDAATLLASDASGLPTGQLLLRGHYVFMDEVGFFRDCETNHSWPVATAGASDELEQDYGSQSGGRDAVVFLKAEAHLVHQPDLTGSHSEEALVIDRIIDLEHNHDCKSREPGPALAP